MADSERPSPFTIPEPAFKFTEGPPSEPPPLRSMTVGGLIHNLTVFADFYERASADIDREEGVMKPWYIGNRDANADVMQRDFRATVAIDRIRAYVLAKYGADLTIGTARRLLGELIRLCALTVREAEELTLEGAMDKLEAAESRRDDAEIVEPTDGATVPTRKRSTERGEGRTKLITALTKHHRYADGSCLNLEPIGNNELAAAAGVSPSTASAFFNQKFKGHTKYKALCRDSGRLIAALKLLNNEFSPHDLYGRRPADEDDRGEDGDE